VNSSQNRTSVKAIFNDFAISWLLCTDRFWQNYILRENLRNKRSIDLHVVGSVFISEVAVVDPLAVKKTHTNWMLMLILKTQNSWGIWINFIVHLTFRGGIWEAWKVSGLQRVQTPSKSWLFQSSICNCLNCVHNCDDHSLLDSRIMFGIDE